MTPEAAYMILGAALSIAGGVIGSVVMAWVNSLWTRYNRMQDIIAQKKIENNQLAFSHMKTVEGLLVQGTIDQVNSEIEKHSDWYFSNAIFLPTKFCEKWLTLRSGVYLVSIHEKEGDRTITPEQLTDEYQRLSVLAKELLIIIYKDMHINPVKPKPFRIVKS
ncbi:MAG: hypothetical protein WCY36_06235 [Candidatus Omnitrophota bacterium]